MFAFLFSEANKSWLLKATKWVLLASLKVGQVSWPGGAVMATEADVEPDKSQRKPFLLDN